MQIKTLFHIYKHYLSEFITIYLQSYKFLLQMSHNESLISQNNSSFQEAKDYNSLLEENNNLRKELEKFRALDIDIKKIIMIRKELISLKKFNQSENIDLEDFAKSVELAVEKSFCIKKSGFKQQSQKIISMIFSLYENEANWDLDKEKNENKGEEKVKQHFVFAQKVKQEIKQEVKSEVKSQEFSKITYSRYCNIEEDKTQKKSAYDKFNKIQKDSKETIQEIPSNSFQNEKTQKKEQIKEQIPKRNQQIPFYSRQTDMAKKEDKFYNKDEYEQSKILDTKQKQDILFPINWEQKSYFKVDSGLIRKMINDDYRKIRALNPFPKFGQHTVRFQMIKQGTVAFGIVTDQYKDGLFIDDRKVDAIKYLSFYNGGGKLSMNGLELSEGRRLHLRESQIIEITFDADRQQVRYSNKNFQKPIVIELQNAFKSRSLYFFVQMKTLSTTIKIL